MRQTMAKRITMGVAVVLAGVLVLFACGRRGGQQEARKSGQQQMESHEGHDHEGDAHQAETKAKDAGAETQGQQASPEQQALSGNVQDGVRVVEVAARQFEFEPATNTVQQGEKVRLEVTSQDVTHGIGIEDFGIDQMLPPNETKTVTFTAGEPGTHHFHCSVFCGPGHNRMHGEIVVRPAPGGGDNTGG